MKKSLPIILAIAVALVAFWPSNAFADNMGQKTVFPGLAKYPYDGFPYADGGSYSGTLWTYWWEKDCGPESDPDAEWLCFDRLITLFGWRISSPEDALLRVDMTTSNRSFRELAVALIPARGERYPDFAKLGINYSLWEVWMPGFPEEEPGDHLVLNANLWGKFLPESCVLPGFYLGWDLENWKLRFYPVPCRGLHS